MSIPGSPTMIKSISSLGRLFPALLLGSSLLWGRDAVIVDASQFFTLIPRGDTIDGRNLGEQWQFNNTVLNLGSSEDCAAHVNVPEAGQYQLFVRSQGTEGSSFKITINGKATVESFGAGGVSFKP